VSLAKCSLVNRTWHSLATDSPLWKRLCFLPKWRFSPASESKQLQKYDASGAGRHDWKAIFSERFKVRDVCLLLSNQFPNQLTKISTLTNYITD
jgi:hypothetical protein